MARIKLDMPGSILATFNIPVRITDINYGNHLGNYALVGIIHECRVQWLSQHGFTELNAGGTGLIMADLAVQYKQESFYGDILEIGLAAMDISRVGFDLHYEIRTNRNGQTIEIAMAKTGMVCYDYSKSKVMAVPEALVVLLNPLI